MEPSSRVIVKNIPSYVSEQAVKSHFSSIGLSITDIKVAKTSAGKSRRFAFVGFQSEEEAKKARNHFNNTFFDTSKIQVEFAKPVRKQDILFKTKKKKERKRRKKKKNKKKNRIIFKQVKY